MIKYLLTAFLIAAPLSAQEAVSSSSGAMLRGLDKISGEVRDIEISAGENVAFGRLDITLDDCRYPRDNPAGDAYAHLVIRVRGAEETVFDGWMIASSPALNALDHPRYDVWVMRCNIS